MSEMPGNKDDRKQKVKELIMRLHQGEDPGAVKEEFKEVIKGLSPFQIAKIEGEMIKDGMPREEIHNLCDVHLAAMKDAIEGTAPMVPEWHPLRVLLGEHREFLKAASQLRELAKQLKAASGKGEVADQIRKVSAIVGDFPMEELHYQREENVLFPYLEKHGVTEPPAIMWMDHDRIREMKKNISSLVSRSDGMDFSEFTRFFMEAALAYHEMVSSHFYKENNILFPSSVQVIEDAEWKDIRKQFDDIGYFKVKPLEGEMLEGESESPEEVVSALSQEGEIRFEAGSLRFHELEPLFNSLPVDITFVDNEDRVRYFSQTKDRIFVRAKAIIGREVKNCHPQKSVHVVSQIVSDFKSGKRDNADFWINLNDRMILIRYYAVRNKDGDYLGTVEVSQDITEIQQLSGEKRLLD